METRKVFDEAQHIRDSFSEDQIKEMWTSVIPKTNNMTQEIKSIESETQELLSTYSVEDAIGVVNEKIQESYKLQNEKGFREYERLNEILDYLKNK